MGPRLFQRGERGIGVSEGIGPAEARALDGKGV